MIFKEHADESLTSDGGSTFLVPGSDLADLDFGGDSPKDSIDGVGSRTGGRVIEANWIGQVGTVFQRVLLE